MPAVPPPPSPSPRPDGALAIVPLKALDRAKGRLAADLDPSSRRALVAWMFGRVLTACREAAQVGQVLVVAGDRAAAALAEEHGAGVLLERRPGLARALATADAATMGAPATLILAADLPLARGADLDRVCAAAYAAAPATAERAPGPTFRTHVTPSTGSGPAVVVAPTRDGGTGALYRRPPAVIPTRYGPGSAAAHLHLAVTAGARAVRLDVPSLALDVDTPGQLREAAGLDGDMAAWASALRRQRHAGAGCAPPDGRPSG